MTSRQLSNAQLRDIAERFKALAEPSRLQILSALRAGERPVSDIIQATGLGQANTSKHLQILYGAGFVKRRKDGVSICYRLADANVLRLCELMCDRLEGEAAERSRRFA